MPPPILPRRRPPRPKLRRLPRRPRLVPLINPPATRLPNTRNLLDEHVIWRRSDITRAAFTFPMGQALPGPFFCPERASTNKKARAMAGYRRGRQIFPHYYFARDSKFS
ncbi:hypothetical protein EYC51_14665 [Alcaligenes faecalis]|nr:hypothetical protein EYC51_14665 [Alcaligenes faecalis]